MKRSCHFLIKLLPIPTLVLLLLLGLSESLDPDYESCKPYACGGLSISFPFYVPSIQPSFCGLGKFKVSCNNKSQTIIPISGDDYIINNINYEEMSINITNSAFSNSALSCHSSIHNLTLDDDHRFDTSSFKHKYILLLHNCSRKLAASSKNYTGINCQDNEHHQGLLWAVYFEDFYPSEFGVCKNPVEVPYDEDEDESESSTSIEGLLSRGFLLKYKSLNCSHCVDSGGRCGINKTTSELLCYCPDRPHHSSCHPPTKVKKWKIILPSVLSAIVLIILALLIVYWLKRKNKSGVSTFRSTIMSFNRTITDMDGISMKGVTVFSYKELEEATHNFDPERELGEGGFGIVYYGKLKDGREVAVKRLYEKNYKRIEQFKNEIKILTDLRHDNLVTLYGCTSRHSRELLLVYEYIPNKTVADHLHSDQTKSVLLPWSTRMKIAIETATALSYLHSKEIIHRDVKTNNILLDNDFSVKVADFGLSRLFPADVTHISTAPQGTPGYVDPEYHQCYHLTDKSDVYSFGVVLVELISSLPAVDVGRHRHEINLSNYAITRIQNSAFSDLVDPNLGFERDFKVRRMTSWVAELAFQCLQHERDSRPSIEEALEVLKSIESMDYDALEEEEMSMSPRATKFMKPPPSPTDNDVVNLLRDTGRPSASPVSVMDKWLNSSKSTTPATSRSS